MTDFATQLLFLFLQLHIFTQINFLTLKTLGFSLEQTFSFGKFFEYRSSIDRWK